MRIWQQHSLGDPMELLRLEEVDDPVVDPGKVLVEVEAVGLTFVNCLMARGIDPVGGDVFDRSRRVMAWDGRLLVIGFTSGRIPEAPANHVLLKNYSIVGVHWGASVARNPQASEQAHQRLLTLLQEERINPPVFPPFAFEDTPAALGAIYNRSTWGKVIVQR